MSENTGIQALQQRAEAAEQALQAERDATVAAAQEAVEEALAEHWSAEKRRWRSMFPGTQEEFEAWWPSKKQRLQEAEAEKHERANLARGYW